MIIDCHGRNTTAPAAHDDWRDAQKAAFRSVGNARRVFPRPDAKLKARGL